VRGDPLPYPPPPLAGGQYHLLATDYGSLAKETRDLQKAMQADLAEIRKRVESIERMMREVG